MTSLSVESQWQSYVEEGLDHIPKKCIQLAFDTKMQDEEQYIKNPCCTNDPYSVLSVLKKLKGMEKVVDVIENLGIEDFFQTEKMTFFAPLKADIEKIAKNYSYNTKNFQKYRFNRMLDIINAHLLPTPVYPEQLDHKRELRLNTLFKKYYIISNGGKLICNTSTKSSPAKIVSAIQCTNGMIYVLDKLIEPDVNIA